MSESPRAAPRADAPALPDRRALLQRAQDLARRSAEIADAVASTLEVLAATYRRMADGARLPSTTARLLEHVVRLENRALDERAAAAQFRRLVGRSSPIS